MSVSASHGYRINELREEVARMLQEFPEEEEESEEEKGLKIAMLGRPNAGKSSMVNALTGKTRLIVSPIAGTTRDSVDVSFESRGQRYTFVDTAGVRRRAQVRDSLERFSVMRALKSSKRADVVVLVLDGPQGLTRQDKRLLEFLVKEKTPFMVAVNKMDLVGKSEKAEFKLDMEFAMRICPHVPLVYTSTITRAGLGSILAMARTIWEECQVRITTGQLNRAMEQVLSRHQPPLVKGRRAKFYYLTQAQTNPPVFVFFVNKVENIKTSYRRYLENSLRKLFAIKYAPIGIHFRSSHGDKKK